MLVVRIIGNAKPTNENIAERCGDTCHAKKESKSKKIDTMVTVRKSSFINFLIIIVMMIVLCYFLLASNS